MPVAYCQVIVDIAHEDVDRVFTYRVPEGMKLCPGMRVHVPFGRMKRIEGVVVSMEDACDLPDGRVKDVADTLEDYPAILPNLLHLAMQIKEHASVRWRRRFGSCSRRRCAASASTAGSARWRS